MIMFTRAYQVDGRTVVVAYLNRWRVAVADYCNQVINTAFLAEDMFDQAFDLSKDGARLVTGHDGGCRFRVWSTKNAKMLCEHGKPTAARVRFDRTGDFVLTWATGRYKHVYSLSTGEHAPLPNLGDLNGAYLDADSNTLFAPIDGQSRMFAITFAPLTIGHVALPFKAGIYSLRRSPINDNIVLFYDNGRIECRNGIQGDLLWSRVHVGKDLVSGGCYSLNGRFVAMALIDREQLWVINSETGELTHAIDQMRSGFTPGSPLPGNLILSYRGQILDAENGRISDGLNSIEWWRRAGL